MVLFQLKNNQVIINPEMLLIPEFKTLWGRDKSKDKDNAFRELSYVFFTADFNSPYSSMPENKREGMVIEDFIKIKGWKPDADIQKAVDKYKFLSETPSMRLLNSVRGVIDRIHGYLNHADIDDRTIKNIMDTLVKVSSVVGAQSKLEDAVKKEITQGSRARGEKEIGGYER